MMKFESNREFFSYFLDENWTISKKILDANNWCAVPVPNTLTLIESEWLAKSIFLYGSEYLEYCFEHNSSVHMNIITNSADNLMNTEFYNSHKYIIITNNNLDFLYFKNQNNLYHLFCGSPDFVFSCINCSLNMAKKIFFSYGVDNFDERYDEHHYLKDIWDTYQMARAS